MNKKEIDKIGSLTFMQKALLMHSLKESEDRGIITVEADLIGTIERSHFDAAWKTVVEKHEALRTSIHWQNVSKPLQVVHKQVDVAVEYHESDEEPDLLGNRIIAQMGEEGLKLDQAPIMKVIVINPDGAKCKLLWFCHHILVDGWSSGVVLKDLVDIYEDLLQRNSKNYQSSSLIEALKSNLVNDDVIENFWRNKLKSYSKPQLFVSVQSPEAEFSKLTTSLDTEVSNRLRTIAKGIGVSLNTIFQAAWIVLLQSYFKQEDVITGITFSGRLRSSDIDMTSVVGMLMNVLPLRVNKAPSDLEGFFLHIQNLQSELIDFENIDLDRVLYYKNYSSNLNLFDNLIVFENYPSNNLKNSQFEIRNLRSGVTSSYNVNCLVRPLSEIEYDILYNNSVKEQFAQEINQNLEIILQGFCDPSFKTIEKIRSGLSFTRSKHPTLNSRKKRSMHERLLIYDRNIEGTGDSSMRERNHSDAYEAPENSQQLHLSQIWEDLFGMEPIGIKDNFFELGGTSMMAVQLFTQVEKNMGISLPPTALISSPTIEELERLVRSSSKPNNWASLVPLRKNGQKRPLFCLHAGGAHVMFYHDLAKHLSSEQPVYAIQPIGLDDINKAHESIEEMASFYIKEIQKVQPTGPYSLLGTCFSDAVALEIAHQLSKIGEQVSPLIVVDSEPIGIRKQKYNKRDKIKLYVNALRHGKFQFITNNILRFLKRRFISSDRIHQPDNLNDLNYSDQKRNQLKNLKLMRDNLFELYESYKWKTYQQDVTFIQSEDFGGIQRKEVLLNQWQQVIDGKILTHTVRGHHLGIFQEPDVRNLANKVEECLEKSSLELAS